MRTRAVLSKLNSLFLHTQMNLALTYVRDSDLQQVRRFHQLFCLYINTTGIENEG